MYREGHKSIRKFKEPIFKDAKDLTKKDYLGIAINTDSKLPQWDGVEDNRFGHHKNVNEISKLFTNECFWYVIGRYIGDGWQRDDATHKGIIICSNDAKLQTLQTSLDNCNLNYSVSNERTTNKVVICSKELFYFVQRYGKYAYGKRVDGETISLPINLLKFFLQGYIESDGCFSNGYYNATTVSRELAYGLAQCIEKVYKTPCKIYFSKRPEKHIIEGRIVNQKDNWILSWKLDVCKQDKAFYENGYIWFPIKRIETREEECDVYNMEVEEDHSYTANGAIVHNCQSISNAGLQHGFTEGSGTRSSIIWFVREAIKVKKPKYLMLENVAAMVSSKFLPMFNLWQHELEKYGYTNYAQVLNAKDYGVPQNRKRIFMISKLTMSLINSPNHSSWIKD
jgi:Site-specific DNA methylase